MRRFMCTLTLVITLCLSATAATAGELQLVVGRAVIELQAPDGYVQARLTLVSPDGRVFEQQFPAGTTRLRPQLEDVIDGPYRYRLCFDGPESPATADGEQRRAMAHSWPELNGQFGLLGQDLMPGNSSETQESQTPQPKDQIINDDLIVQGGVCVGIDCVDGENFNFMRLKLKENNTRIRFDDTSAGAGVPARDWQITANDSAAGGLEKFSIEDITAGRVPFTILGNAPSNSVFVDSSGRLGLGTATPSLQLHLASSNTPAVRLEQTNAGGFTAQTWDVAGNETVFFVRDVTAGLRRPFVIRAGAASSSIEINAMGQVGFGTAVPSARVHVQQDSSLNASVAAIKVRNTHASVPIGSEDRFTVDSTGNVTARGTISQLSSRSAKENFQEAEPGLLARLASLPVSSWNYIGTPADERHIGPVAEDFHAAFGVGGDPRFLAPADVAGVALASVKALQTQVNDRDARIAELENRLARLEALLQNQH